MGGELVDDHGSWSYVTVLAALVESVVLVPQEESAELRWVPESQVTDLDLHPGFAGTWPVLREQLLGDARVDLGARARRGRSATRSRPVALASRA